jgi:hypothetical protein
MDSLPEQHIEDLPGASREAAYEKVRLVFLKRWKGDDSEDKIAIDSGFGGANAMHQQLSAWGFAGLLPPHKESTSQKTTPQNKARGSGPLADLPPAANAVDIFQGTVEKLSVFVERLSLRKEHRQGKRSVLSNARPILEARAPGEDRAYVEAPPDAQPDEHGYVRYSAAQAYARVPGGAAPYPDEELTAAIAAALLVGYSTDKLLDALQPDAAQEIREKAHVLFEGNTASTRPHSLKNKARQIAAVIRGYPRGRGDRDNAVTKEWQSAAWAAQEWRGYGYENDEIAGRLNEDDTLLHEFKKHHRVTVDDVRDLISLDLKPYQDFMVD